LLGLSNAFEIARSSLQDSSARSAVLSRNILGVNDPSYARRAYSSITSGNGTIAEVERAVNSALANKMLTAVSREGFAASQVDMLSQLQALLADPESVRSIPALLANLNADILRFSADPANSALGSQVISTAGQLVDTLRTAAEEAGSVRELMNVRLQEGVAELKTLIAEFGEIDETVARGLGSGRDVNDAMDQRDRLIEKINKYISVRSVAGAGGRISLYTDGGHTLFEKIPRDISLLETFDEDIGGNVLALSIDGIDATSSQSVMRLRSGEFAGLIQFRNEILKPGLIQLDEMARSLVSVFADRDRNAVAAAPDAPGLITADSLSGLPASRVPGLAAQLKLSDFAESDNAVRLLRDGGFANPLDPAYNHNINSDEAFNSRIQSVIAQLAATAGLETSGLFSSDVSLGEYASSSSVWLARTAKSLRDESETQGMTRQYAQQQLRAATGVSLDDETSKMLEIERSYQSTAKLISAIDGMFLALLEAVN
jgi:flagellar hook-associated protein 1 FlgK